MPRRAGSEARTYTQGDLTKKRRQVDAAMRAEHKIERQLIDLPKLLKVAKGRRQQLEWELLDAERTFDEESG